MLVIRNVVADEKRANVRSSLGLTPASIPTTMANAEKIK